MTIEKLNVNETNEEETVMTEEEMMELMMNIIAIGGKQWRKIKFRIFGKGLILGLTAAVAIQSLITVMVLLAYLT